MASVEIGNNDQELGAAAAKFRRSVPARTVPWRIAAWNQFSHDAGWFFGVPFVIISPACDSPTVPQQLHSINLSLPIIVIGVELNEFELLAARFVGWLIESNWGIDFKRLIQFKGLVS